MCVCVCVCVRARARACVSRGPYAIRKGRPGMSVQQEEEGRTPEEAPLLLLDIQPVYFLVQYIQLAHSSGKAIVYVQISIVEHTGTPLASLRLE